MDDVYQQHSPYRASNSYDGYRRQQPTRHKRPLTTPGVHGKTSDPQFSSYLTGQNFSIAVAFFFIYLFQRKDGFGGILAARRGRGLWNVCLDWWCEIHDYVKAFSQMLMEVMRNLRLHMLAHGDEWFYDFTSLPPHSPHPPPPPTARGRRRNMVAPVTSRISGVRMPELEEIDTTSQLLQQQQRNLALGIVDGESQWDKENTAPLEPAFLKDEDYPPGWLVFDPVLGVVSKVEADKYKREKKKKVERLQKQQRGKQQQHKSFQPEEGDDDDDTEEPQQQPQQQPVDHAKSNVRQPQQQSMQQQKQPSATQHQQKTSSNSKSNASSCPLRNNNVMPNASAMHTPHTIAANG